MQIQFSFPDDDSTDANAIVQVAAAGRSKALSRAQKTFNRLTAKIEDQRRQLGEWQSFGQSFASRVASEMSPLQRRIDEQRRALLRGFDSAHDGGKLTRREQGKLAWLICERAAELLEGEDDAELIALHDKYSDVSHHDVRQGQVAAMKLMTEAALGMSFDDDEIQTAGDLIAALHRRIGIEVGRGTRQERGTPGPSQQRFDDAQRRSDKPTSARSGARLERERAAIEGATRSVREVYRKLASALHPDRETDPTERDRKTALMQRANQAYDAKDLLQLLNLQIEVELIDLSQLSAVGDDRLGHYNRVLKERSAQLGQEIEGLMEPFARSLSGRTARDLTPAMVVTAFQRDVAELRRESAWLAQQLDAFRDLRMLKAWLKAQRVERTSIPDPINELDRLIATMAVVSRTG